MLLCSSKKKKKKIRKSIVCEQYWNKQFEELGRSFTYKKNNNGPSIEHCGVPHLISFFAVSADSVIFIYCFLPYCFIHWQTK